MASRTVRPGRYRTFCGLSDLSDKPPTECAGQPREVILAADAIRPRAFEVADAFYVWDAARGRFRRVQMGD